MPGRDYQALKNQDQNDVRTMAWSIHTYLHFCTETPTCEDPTQCKMCFNAARLAVQHYRPIIEKRTVRRFVDYFDAGCTMSHPGGD